MTLAEQMRADIARRVALIAHCRTDWQACIRVLVEAGEMETHSARAAGVDVQDTAKGRTRA